jgi:hypothetical protein
MTDTKNAIADGNGDTTTSSEPLTDAQRLQLEEAQARRAEAELRAKEIELERAKLDAQNVALRFEQNFSDAVRESGCDFYIGPPQLRKLLESEPGLSIQPGADGRCLCERDGQRVPLRDTLRAFALASPFLIKNETELLMDADLVRSRDMLKTNQQKSAFITAHGAAAFERLPMQPAKKLDVGRITCEEWLKLSSAQKVKLIAQGANVAEIVQRRG